MKKSIFACILAIAALAAALPAAAQNREDALKEISKLSNSQKEEDRAKAYERSKEYISKYGTDKEDKNLPKVRNFVTKYRQSMFAKDVDTDKYPEAFTLGREIIAEQPDNVNVMLNLAYAGYNANNKAQIHTYDQETVTMASKSLEMMDKGTLPATFEPFKDRDEATAFMYFIQGRVGFDKDMRTAAGNLYKSTQYTSNLKTSSAPIALIAYYYEDLYQKAAIDYQSKADSKTITAADKKAASDKLNKIVDRMLDSYARMIKFGEAEKNPDLEKWRERFGQIYKFKKGSDAGQAEYLTTVAAQPMPDPTTL